MQSLRQPRHIGLRAQIFQPPALGQETAHQRRYRGLIDQRGDGGEVAPRIGRLLPQHMFQSRLLTLRRHPLVHQLEMRRQARLQRKAAQQGLAEAVDGLDFQPAAGLQHPGEQTAGVDDLPRLRLASKDVAQLEKQLFVFLGGPVAETLVQAVRHLRCRRAGEGQAEDAFGRGAVQQQAQQALDQHMGLAGAGGSGDPDRGLRIGRVALQLAGSRAAFCDVHHQSPGPPADHSLTRDR